MSQTLAGRSQVTQRFLTCGLVAGPLFVVAFLLEGLAKSDGYNALRHPVSSLALGEHGWAQTANFLVCGTLAVLFAIGLWRTGQVPRTVAALVGIWGVGLIGAGLFVTDPVSGYPPGTADAIEYTTIGTLHDAFSLPAFLALTLASLVLAVSDARRKRPALAAYSVLSGIAFFVLFALAGSGFSQTPSLVDHGGLYQRICLIIGWTWIVVLALRTRRT